jgi:hypothetical protein
MQRTIRGVLASCVLLGCSACGGEDKDEAGARDLWARLQEADYRTWAPAPGWETRQETVSAHGQQADIFINDAVVSALLEESLEAWPVGSLLVKDSYRGEALALIAALEKRDSGWYFAEWNGAGELKFAGSPSVCRNCHDAADDSVFSVGLP